MREERAALARDDMVGVFDDEAKPGGIESIGQIDDNE